MKERIKTELITEYMEKERISKTKFCKMCGISQCAFKKIMNNDISVYVKPLLKVGKMLGYELKDMFTKV